MGEEATIKGGFTYVDLGRGRAGGERRGRRGWEGEKEEEGGEGVCVCVCECVCVSVCV